MLKKGEADAERQRPAGVSRKLINESSKHGGPEIFDGIYVFVALT